MDANLAKYVLEHGRLCFPAASHYVLAESATSSFSVFCDRCGRQKLALCVACDIGDKSYDMCMACADAVAAEAASRGPAPMPCAHLETYTRGLDGMGGDDTVLTTAGFEPQKHGHGTSVNSSHSKVYGSAPGVFVASKGSSHVAR